MMTISAPVMPGHPTVHRSSPMEPVASAALPVGSGDWIVEVVAGTLLALCLIGMGLMLPSISRQRDELQLAVSLEGTKGMPPHVALVTAALGTFRGLAVDLLWIRADDLQDKGDYFEAQTLSEWITMLQPRFPKVWEFQAHNLAYNISVRASDPWERWGWVSRGIELLRSRGIPLNPQSPKLYEELGFILMHKVGGKHDREHWYLKQRLCAEMQEVLGDKASDRSEQEALDAFRPIATAPDSVEELLETTPEVAAVLALLEANGMKPDESFLRMLGLVVMVDASIDAKLTAGAGLPAGTNREIVKALRQDPGLAAACFQKLLPVIQKQVVRQRYRMEPERMLALMEQYGPLDWRHASAQGIYWMEEATRRVFEARNRANRDELVLLRRRLSMISDLMRNGRINYDAMTDKIDLLPDPRFIEPYENALAGAIEMVASETGVATEHWGRAEVSDLMKGYERFLHEATVLSFVYGDERKAGQCYEKLRRMAEEGGWADQPIYREGLEMFVALRLGEVLKLDISNTRQFIDGMLHRALVDGLSRGRMDVFNKFLRMAYRVYDKKYSASDPTKIRIQKQVDIGSFPELVDASFKAMMRQGGDAVLTRARIWAWAPDEMKARVWIDLEADLTEQAVTAGLDPARAFPPPRVPESPPGSSGSEAAEERPAAKPAA